MAVLRTDNKHTTLHGVILMIISGVLCALLSVSMQWYSEKMNYSIAQILFHISLFQLILTLVSSMINIQIDFCPNCKINFSMNFKNTLNAIENMNDYEYIYSRRVSSSYVPTSRSPTSSMANISSMASSVSHLYQSNPNYLSFNHNQSKFITSQKIATCKKLKISTFFIEKVSPTKIWTLILLRGIIGTLGLFTSLKSQKIVNMVDSVAIQPLSIITSTIIGCVFLADPLTKYHVIAVFLAITGSLMIVQPPFITEIIDPSDYNYTQQSEDHMARPWIGYLLAFISSFCMGFVFLCIRAASRAPAFLLILSQSLWNIIGCVLMIKFWDKDPVKISNDYTVVLYAAVFGLILYLSALTMTKGIQRLIIGVSNVIKTGTNVIFGLIFEMMISSIYPTWSRIIGVILSILGVIIISTEKVKTAPRQSLFELFETKLERYEKQHGDTEKDMVDTYYTFDEDEQGGYTTLIM